MFKKTNSCGRKRNITWSNLPSGQIVATNISKTFLKILDEEFLVGHILHKIFNRNTVNTSYSCMSNIKHNIDGHNKSILLPIRAKPTHNCNCRKLIECPLPKDCLTESVNLTNDLLKHMYRTNEKHILDPIRQSQSII